MPANDTQEDIMPKRLDELTTRELNLKAIGLRNHRDAAAWALERCRAEGYDFGGQA